MMYRYERRERHARHERQKNDYLREKTQMHIHAELSHGGVNTQGTFTRRLIQHQVKTSLRTNVRSTTTRMYLPLCRGACVLSTLFVTVAPTNPVAPKVQLPVSAESGYEL